MTEQSFISVGRIGQAMIKINPARYFQLKLFF